jgi:hypothetical protein
MPHLGEEIAVLDGLELGGLDISPAQSEAASVQASNVRIRKNVIDASSGANYSGGSSFPDSGRIPLMPSTVGLADADLLAYQKTVSVLPPRRNVIDPSMGANYGGGSSFPDSGGTPLLPSNAGLAGCVGGCYAGVPLGELDAYFGTSLSVQGRENVRIRKNVIDASSGANYSGGSSFPDSGRIPLMPSTVGLAGLNAVDVTDEANDEMLLAGLGFVSTNPLRFKRSRFVQAFRQKAGRKRLKRLKGAAQKIQKAYRGMSPAQRQAAIRKLSMLGSELARIRAMRRSLLAKLTGRPLPMPVPPVPYRPPVPRPMPYRPVPFLPPPPSQPLLYR